MAVWLSFACSFFTSWFVDFLSLPTSKIVGAIAKKEHKKAKHFPYAYKYQNTAGKSDAQEPTNTAGLPLYNLLEFNNLNNNLLVVVRYFGGTKLGVGPLTRAYKEAANKAIKKWLVN